MREIKFRGKSINNGKWIHGSLVGTDVIAGGYAKTWDDDLELDEWEKVDPETVGQYTGLRDANDVEIYEGDLILYKGNKGKVFFDEVNMQFMFETEDGGYEFCNGQVYDEWPEYGTYEVIGNIYDNPEYTHDQRD